MTIDARAVIERHWSLANAGDWEAFAQLLEPALQYDVPQTRERIRSGAGYLDMFRTWPGPWRAEIRRLVAEPGAAVCQIDFVTAAGTMTGISFFRLGEDGRIREVVDYWPEPYEPPARVSAHMERY